MLQWPAVSVCLYHSYHTQTHHDQRACLQLKASWSVADIGEAVVLEAAQNLQRARLSMQGSASLRVQGTFCMLSC